MLESRLTLLTIVTSCFLNSCCLSFVTFVTNSSFFNGTVPRHTGHVTPSVSLNVTHLHSSRQICGRWIAQTLIRSTTRSRALYSTEFTRQRSRIWKIWNAIWLTYGLVSPYRRRYQPVAYTSLRLCSSQRWTLRTFALTLASVRLCEL